MTITIDLELFARLFAAASLASQGQRAADTEEEEEQLAADCDAAMEALKGVGYDLGLG